MKLKIPSQRNEEMGQDVLFMISLYVLTIEVVAVQTISFTPLGII